RNTQAQCWLGELVKSRGVEASALHLRLESWGFVTPVQGFGFTVGGGLGLGSPIRYSAMD
ncbi:hypothetical protein L0F63_003906, partial [Massospora cicadina]